MLNDNGILFRSEVIEGGLGIIRLFVGGKRSLVFFVFWLIILLAGLFGAVMLVIVSKDNEILISGLKDMKSLIGSFFERP